MSIRQIVDLTITRETKVPSRQGFGIPIIVGPNAEFLTRTKKYSTEDLSELAEDLTGGVDAVEYKMAQAIAMQRPRVPYVVIGRKEGAESYSEALDEIYNEDSTTWYAILIASQAKEDQISTADWTELNQKKIFFCASSDSDIIDLTLAQDIVQAEPSISAYVKNENYDYTTVFYHSEANTRYPDAGLVGVLLTKDEGTYTAMFKTIRGLTADSIPASKVINALAKSTNIYEEIGSENMVREGTMASGEFIDVIIFEHWLEVEIVTNVFRALKRVDKIAFTNEGAGAIESEIDKALSVGQNRTGLSPTQRNEEGDLIGGYEIIVQNVFDIPMEQRANRVLPDVSFEAYLAGAIHHTVIRGRLLV